MHDIEPYYKWRDHYTSESDDRSPFYGRVYNEFQYTQKVYNYFIHPQWDDFGSQTLYAKITFVDYHEGYAMIELIGEWNDCLHNDVMFLKRELIDYMLKEDIYKYIILCDNVLNFHPSDDSYYEEWYEDVSDEGGWIALINTQDHVLKDMEQIRLQNYVNIGMNLIDVLWHGKKAPILYKEIELKLANGQKQLVY